MRELRFLVTNDDGIESPFVAALVAALLAHGRVIVVAPRVEQSWISKAMSRRTQLTVKERRSLFGCEAWDVNGTPADCVNLALAHLVKDRVDAVVSGINIGTNAALPLILASGTVGGALEGALHGYHAIASSLRLAPEDMATLRQPGARVPAHLATSLQVVARRTAALAEEVARKPQPRSFFVHNLNFPAGTNETTTLERSVPAPLHAGSLFQRSPTEGDEFYTFTFAVGEQRPCDLLTDRACIESGRASYTILDYGRLGVTKDVAETTPSS
jgi:5'-nucleotidase